MHQQVQHSATVRPAHTVFRCFVFIWERTVTCATYSVNWLVFITEMKSVYCAVQTGPLTLILLTWRIGWVPNNAIKWQMGFNSAFKELNKAVCASSLNC